MSRGFVKEDDLEHAGTNLPERPVSVHPNYVTLAGLVQLQQQSEALEQERQQLAPHKDDPVASQRLGMVERDLRYLQARLESALLVEPVAQTIDQVLFGATVNMEDENGDSHTFSIVGEDEADINLCKVSYLSPLATALIGHKIGESVIWPRPAGNLELTIAGIDYPSNPTLIVD